MNSRQIRMAAVALLVLAALLALLAWQVARQAAVPQPVQGAAPMHAVVVTTRAVEAGKPLPADALKVMQLPIDPTGAYQDVARVTGQVPVVALGANVPVLEGQLLAGLARQVPEGQRAMAVAVDEVIGVGHQVQPGDYVDVFVVLRRDSQEIADSQARMLLSRLRVLAYGASAVNEAKRAEGGEQMMARREGAKTAVLSVPLEQVSKLVMAQQAGRLTLALRNPRDETMPGDGLLAEPLARLVGTGPVRPAPQAVAPIAPSMPAPAVARPASNDTRSGVEMIRAGRRDIE